MRSVLRGSVALLLVLGVAACSSGSDQSTSKKTTTTTSTTTTTIKTLQANEVDAKASPYCATWAEIRNVGGPPLTGDAKKDTEAAKADIAKALEQRRDYADAIFLLSQIQIAEGDVSSAVKSVEAVATLNPTDPGIFFQLGLLYYNQKNYQMAVLALERAVTLSPQYANAKYFLGLSYYQAGDKARSLAQFKDLAASNPDSQEVKAAVAAIESGKSPIAAPADDVPVKQSTTKEAI